MWIHIWGVHHTQQSHHLGAVLFRVGFKAHRSDTMSTFPQLISLEFKITPHLPFHNLSELINFFFFFWCEFQSFSHCLPQQKPSLVQELHPVLSELGSGTQEACLKPNSKNATTFLAGGRCRNPSLVALGGPLLLLGITCTSTPGSIHLFCIRCAAKPHTNCACTASLLKTCWSYSFLGCANLVCPCLIGQKWNKRADLGCFIPGSSVFIKGERKEENILNFILNAQCQTLSRPPVQGVSGVLLVWVLCQGSKWGTVIVIPVITCWKNSVSGMRISLAVPAQN